MPHINHRFPNLEEIGPTVEVLVAPSRVILMHLQANGGIVPQVRVLGLIDTGATSSLVDFSVAQELGLIVRDVQSILTPSGVFEHNLYDAVMVLPQLSTRTFDVQIVGADLKRQPYRALIGRDVLKHCTFVYHGWDNSYTIHM
jgi:predicted aspartyl protease